ncbi:hypothetical protein DPMN_073144 [Dreissena polymorpha]|uniref:Uncharacterized protein n=1 Tax=Dreissena polymorpha TaxID=45954 RepID=A0A9D4HAI2_DREPO|nr:hypothetical protein DPMN_073144 [Dreissena polymorpha]
MSGVGRWDLPIAAKRKYLIIKKIDEKIRYASNRRIEGINFPLNTPIREEFTSSIIDIMESSMFVVIIVVLPPELATADVAGEVPSTSVDLLVLLQDILVGKGLVARTTRLPEVH